MCALDGFLYAFGGWVGEDIGGSIERYDPGVNEWTLTSKMPEPRFSMGISPTTASSFSSEAAPTPGVTCKNWWPLIR